MHFTNFVKHDGYYESLCSLREGLGPILKCRAVKCLDGNYEAIVRDNSSGLMVASKHAVEHFDLAKLTVQNLALRFIESETTP